MTYQIKNGGFAGLSILGVNLAALPPKEREAARLTPEAAERLMAELDEIFPCLSGWHTKLDRHTLRRSGAW